MASWRGKSGNSDRLVLWTPKSLQIVTAAMKLSTHAPLKKGYDQPRQCMKKQRHYFANKGPYSQSYDFSSSHVWIWELDHKEGWAPKNWCFWNVVLEKTLESPLDIKEIKPVNPEGNQPWIFTGRTDAEAETPILWLPDVKRQLIGKDIMLGKTEGKKRRRHQRRRWLDEHEFEQTLGDSEGQEILVCYSPWSHK